MGSSRLLHAIQLFVVLLAFTPNSRGQDAPLEGFLFPSCPSEPTTGQQVAAVPVAALLLEPLLSQLISGTIDAAGSYLTSAATTNSAHMSTLLEEDFYKLDERGNLSANKEACLVLLSPGGDKPVPLWLAAAKKNSDKLRPLLASPRFYFEAKIKADETPGVSRWNISPNFLHISEFLVDSWSYRNDRTYSVAATFRSRLTGEVFGSFKFDFDNIKPSTWARTKNTADNAADESINPNLDEIASSAQVPFYPVTGAVSAAVLAQQQTAAPYIKASALLTKKIR